MKVKHIYELVFIENDVDVYSVDEFLTEFEKICLKHNVKFDHLNVKLLEVHPND